MFENIGNTIKVMAKIFWWIGTITIVGIILIWPTAFLLYGFGELIIRVTEIDKANKRMQMLSVCEKTGDVSVVDNETIKDIKEEIINKYEEETAVYVDEEEIVNQPLNDECPCCFNKITVEDEECAYCGYKLK